MANKLEASEVFEDRKPLFDKVVNNAQQILIGVGVACGLTVLAIVVTLSKGMS